MSPEKPQPDEKDAEPMRFITKLAEGFSDAVIVLVRDLRDDYPDFKER